MEGKKSTWIKRSILIILGILVGIVGLLYFTDRKVFDGEFNDGSKITIENISPTEIENLNKLCKVWGFTKYHHPKVVAGKVNWDYELFRVMPKVLNAKDSNEVDEILYGWINEFGEIKEGKPSTTGAVMLEADNGWIKDETYLNKELSDLLVKLSKTYITERDKSYVAFQDDTYCDFKNEDDYKNMNFDDDGYRILSLFRYWNIVHYFNPYRTVMGEDWNAVLNDFIPKFLEANDELSYKLTVAELSTKIHDSHGVTYDENKTLQKFWGINNAPLRFSKVEDKIVITKVITNLAKDMDIKVGDVVVKVNDKDIFDVIKEKSKYISLSRDSAIVNNLTPYLFATNEDSLKLDIERDGKEIKTEVKCSQINIYEEEGESNKLLYGNIGYINPGRLKQGEIDTIMKNFMDTRGIIIDLRYYPSDNLIYSLAGYIKPNKSQFSKITMANQSVPGEFIYGEDLESGYDNPNYYKGKVIILNNECTQSNAEFVTMSLRNAPNATVIGSNTIGADGNITTIKLPGGVSTIMTGLGVYYPDKTETQRVGLEPDIRVEPTIEGIKAGRDELIEKALDIINS
ncbi:S41 family peptidase [Clostridium paraputrificum]|uniref:S41 family peptidase n=1 Tax=Clostridium paraputrificum TaxID=29363 RepID=UPI003D352F4D